MSQKFRFTLALAALTLVATGGCSEVAATLDDRPCNSAGGCLSGYVCDAATYTCVVQSNDGEDECTGVGIPRECYTYGDGISDATVGVGPCTTGTHICDDYDDDGYTEWSDCDSEVTPLAQDICNNSVDDDCNGEADDLCDCEIGTDENCYEGQAGTENVGICHGGSRNCVDGTWGACVGQQIPETEVCNGIDDDCDDTPDDDPEASPVPVCNAFGVCAEGGELCTGVAGWICSHLSYEQDEVSCDELDNDCDDEVDEGGICDICNDGLDNDGDRAIDFPDDPGCDSAADSDESEIIASAFCLAPPEGTVPASGIVTGDTTAAGGLFDGNCGANGDDAKDHYYSVTLPAGAAGIYAHTGFAATEFDTLVYVLDTCDDTGLELACGGEASLWNGAIARTGPLDPGTYFVVIDGQNNVDFGNYQALIQVQVAEGWACDPTRGDWGCAPGLDCLPDAPSPHTCQLAACEIEGSRDTSFSLTGNTSSASALFVSSCVETAAPEVIYRLDLASGPSNVLFDLDGATDFDTVMYIRDDCHGDDLACDDDGAGVMGGPSQIQLNGLNPGSYFIFVDGWGLESGNYELTVTILP